VRRESRWATRRRGEPNGGKGAKTTYRIHLTWRWYSRNFPPLLPGTARKREGGPEGSQGRASGSDSALSGATAHRRTSVRRRVPDRRQRRNGSPWGAFRKEGSTGGHGAPRRQRLRPTLPRGSTFSGVGSGSRLLVRLVVTRRLPLPVAGCPLPVASRRPLPPRCLAPGSLPLVPRPSCRAPLLLAPRLSPLGARKQCVKSCGEARKRTRRSG
jgi:hypothetical protein